MSRMFDLLKPTLQPYMDQTTPYEVADYIIIGAPMDITASYRGGTDKAPDSIRSESTFLESFSPRTSMDLNDISICDLGDIRGGETYEEWIRAIETTLSQVVENGKTPILIGGEHSITHGAIRALKPDLVVSFDAHMDLRDDLFNERLCHATFMRRAVEEHDFKLIIIGCRALSREEIEYVNTHSDRISYVSAREIYLKGVEPAVDAIKKIWEESTSVYISVDMDVLDTVHAPAVGNPSPEGLTITHILDIANEVTDKKLQGFDVNEVSPSYDTGLTSIQAAYLLLELMYSRERAV